MAAADLVDVEPCAVAERVAPRAQFREVGGKALANGVWNPPGLPQEPVELAGEPFHGVEPGPPQPLGPFDGGLPVASANEGHRLFESGDMGEAGRS